MEILLLNIASLSLERLVTLATVDKHLARNNTHSHTSSEHIKQSGFTSTGDTLEEIVSKNA